MKYNLPGIAVSVALIAIILASGCIGQPVKDCGSDEACFTGALKTCTKATFKTAERQDQLSEGNRIIYRVSAAITGKSSATSSGACNVEERIAELEIRGNITDLPTRFVGLLVSIVDYNMSCEAGEDIRLDMDGMGASLDNCSGDLKPVLQDILKYKDDLSGNPSKRISVTTAFCAGGQKVVVYIRNIGNGNISLSYDVNVSDAVSGEEMGSVVWLDFSGDNTISDLQPGQMAQFSFPVEMAGGGEVRYSINVAGKTHSVVVRC